VTANDSLHSTQDFADLVIASRKGVPIRLSDVATVSSGQQNRYTAAWFNQHRAVVLRITKRAAANAVEVALLMGIVMVALVMLVFLRRARPTVIAMFSIPLSLAGALVVMWMLS